MSYAFFALSDTGRLREGNEDAVLVDEAHQLAVLADGMGGYNAGEVASAMACAHIQAELGAWLEAQGSRQGLRDVRRAMQTAVQQANRAIFEAANNNPAYVGMGTTLVMAVFQHDHLLLGHVGDSRCYRLRGGSLQALTRDHSLLQEQIDNGLVTPEQARFAPYRNLITRALGVEDTVSLDITETVIEADDVYLLCSDGLSDMVPDEQIATLLLGPGGVADKAQALVDAANENGGRDNISVILVHVQTQPMRRGLLARMLHP